MVVAAIAQERNTNVDEYNGRFRLVLVFVMILGFSCYGFACSTSLSLMSLTGLADLVILFSALGSVCIKISLSCGSSEDIWTSITPFVSDDE